MLLLGALAGLAAGVCAGRLIWPRHRVPLIKWTPGDPLPEAVTRS